MEVIAKNTNMQHAPRKVRPVIGLIRGRTVEDAMTILEHTPRAAAKDVAKLVHSAKANAINNNKMVEDTLVIKTIDCGTAQRLKRYRPAARGQALPYQKRTSHVRVILEGEVKAKKKAPVKDVKADTPAKETKKSSETAKKKTTDKENK